MLRSKVTHELTVGLKIVGGFPEVGDKVENVDFLHGLMGFGGDTNEEGKRLWFWARFSAPKSKQNPYDGLAALCQFLYTIPFTFDFTMTVDKGPLVFHRAEEMQFEPGVTG